MHPALIIIPVAAVMLVPRFRVNHVLKQHHRKDEDFSGTGGELARGFLDRYQLHAVKVEKTDIGDHYDPQAKAVRLTRDKFDRKTLTAVTTAAHEVGHALQDASGYGPFVWRSHLVKVAQVTGEVRTVLLLAVPAAALAEPLGAALGLVAVSLHPAFNPLFMAVAAGAMIFVALHELVPMARRHGNIRLFLF